MREILNWNDNWKFWKDCSDVNIAEGGEAVTLPHTWNAIDGQDGGNDYFRGICLYKKTISKKELPEAEQYYLEINGANSSADVYCNGEKLAHHDGGYSTWRVNLTTHLQEENEISILVDNAPNDEVYPQVADFTFYGGIYRNVNILCVNETHFDLDYYGGTGFVITPEVTDTKATVKMETYVSNLHEGDEILYQILDGGGILVCEQKTADTSCHLVIENVHLWNGTEDPYLYRGTATILRDGKEVDKVSSRFGCRYFKIDPENGFILNGKEYPLHGVSRHQDRDQMGNALLPEHHREDMDLICELGANTIRLAHYQHDQYFYDLCDERGMVIWAEIPYISRHMEGGNENTVSQMKELIVQNYNHPSSCVWGLSNEITMDGAKDPDLIANHRRLNDLVHQMDPTRPTTIACLSMCDIKEEYVHIPDVVSYNHYFGWYVGKYDQYGPWFDKFHETYPDTPIGCSEYGCEALNWHNSRPQSGDYSEEYQAMYHEALIKQLFTRKYIWSTHVWNMFDFGADARAEGGENGMNHKGLVTMDRKYKKDAFYAYKAWLSKDPFVHICGKRYVDRVEEMTKVTVYSNLPEVELFANGESLGKQMAEDHFFYFEVPNTGETELVAVAGECRDESHIKKVESMNQDYILREQGAVLNWFDIEEVEGRFSLNDKIGEIMKTFRGKLWFGSLLLTATKKMKAAQKKNEKPSDAKKSGKKKKAKMPEMSRDLIDMMGEFTVLRLTGMVGIVNISFTKEELLKMNKKLNRIRKPKELKNN